MFDSRTAANANAQRAQDTPGNVPEQSRTNPNERGSVDGLADLKSGELREQWRKLYRSIPPKRIRRDLMALAIGWKRQEKAHGGSGAATKRRLATLAQTLEDNGELVRTRAVRLKPGARLLREWRGETHTVIVVEDGFEWRGERHRSLSAIARAITGTRWSGPRFFGLKRKAAVAAGQEEAADV